MSSAVPGYPPPAPVAPAAPPVGTAPTAPPPVRDEEIRIYGHNNLLYWWPVWAVCFVLAALTYVDGHLMAIVPSGTTVEQVADGRGQTTDVLVAPAGQSVPANPVDGDMNPKLRVAANNNYGVVFVGVLLLVVVITNLTLRGLASFIVIAGLIIVGLTVALLGLWDEIFAWIGGVDVRMNFGGYLAIGIPLFVIWVLSTFVYDHYSYLIVTRGQVRICREVGDGEIAVDATGLLLEKKRDDLFRHWLLGLGSGDLHVKTGGVANLDFEMPNVLFVGSKIARIQDLLREKETAQQAAGA